MSKWISKGDCVVHISNLDVLMTVEDFKYRSGMITNESGEKVSKKMLTGIVCVWIDENRTTIHETFHSKNLIPYVVAKKGAAEAFRFFSREGKYANYEVIRSNNG